MRNATIYTNRSAASPECFGEIMRLRRLKSYVAVTTTSLASFAGIVKLCSRNYYFAKKAM